MSASTYANAPKWPALATLARFPSYFCIGFGENWQLLLQSLVGKTACRPCAFEKDFLFLVVALVSVWVTLGTVPTSCSAAKDPLLEQCECPLQSRRHDSSHLKRRPASRPLYINVWTSERFGAVVCRVANARAVRAPLSTGGGSARRNSVEIKMASETYQTTSNTSSSSRNKRTRRDQLAKMLGRKSGASIAQIQKAFGWQPHTVRAAISTLRKSGALIERTMTEKGSVYRIAPDQR